MTAPSGRDPNTLVEDQSAIVLRQSELAGRTFFLGNEGGFVVYEPVAQNVDDERLVPTKWFGASEFGRTYYEAARVWLAAGERQIHLDRSNQTGFVQHLDGAERIFQVEGCTVRQRFFLANHVRAFLMSLETNAPATLVIEPQFDMRYYQALNPDTQGYAARLTGPGGRQLEVSNHVHIQSQTVSELDFHAVLGGLGSGLQIDLLPEPERFRRKVYLKDEHREKLIQSASLETHDPAPDHAPIWDTYSTTTCAPAHISGSSPLHLLFAFGTSREEASAAFDEARGELLPSQGRKDREILGRIESGALETGHDEVDRAYRQVLTRFNQGLVARGVRVSGEAGETTEHDAIFAGNKYFLDPWKRDENISLNGLLLTDDFAVSRAILEDTWRFQDYSTGRLPLIIRLGEPLVYYSSDATLWALQRLHEYTIMSGDQSLLEDKYAMVSRYFTASLGMAQKGLLPSGGIVDPSYRWETWEDTPYTPRDGFPVEIEMLWLTQIANYLPAIGHNDPVLAGRLSACLEEGRQTFTRFYLDGYLADSLSYQWEPRDLLTPNGYIAFGLGFSLPKELTQSMIRLGREQLAGHVGVRSLAPRDWPKVLAPELLADPKLVRGNDMASVGIYNYHRGVEWLWLSQFLVQAELQHGSTEHAFSTYLAGQVHCALREGGVGGLPELHDLHGVLGADFQAWSMAGFVAALHAFAGAMVDASARTVSVRPSIPNTWPGLRCRRRIGDTRFDVRHHVEGARQVVEVEAVDRIPADHILHLGVRVPAGSQIREVILNGQSMDSNTWHVIQSPAPDVAGEVWIETQWRSKRTTAEFIP